LPQIQQLLTKKINIKKIAQLTGHNASIFALTGGKDTAHFRSGGGEGWVAEWNFNAPENGQLIAKVESQIFSLTNLTNENRLVAGNMNGGAHWVDLDNPDATKNVLAHKKGIYEFLQIGDFLYSAGGEGMLTKWSVSDNKTVESIHLSNQSLRSLAYAENRKEIAVGASDNHIYLLDSETLSLKKMIANAHENSVFTVKYHPNNQHLLSGGRDAHLNIWDLENDFEKISSQPAHWFTINAIAFHPDGQLFATGSRDKTIKIWDSETFELLKVLDTIRNGCHVNSVNALYWSSFNNYLVSGSDDRSLIIWEVV